MRLPVFVLWFSIAVMPREPLHAQAPPWNDYYQPEWLPPALARQHQIKRITIIGQSPLNPRSFKDSTLIELDGKGRVISAAHFRIGWKTPVYLSTFSFWEYDSVGLPFRMVRLKEDKGRVVPDFVHQYYHDGAGRIVTDLEWEEFLTKGGRPDDSLVYRWTDWGALAQKEHYAFDDSTGWNPHQTQSYYFDEQHHLVLTVISWNSRQPDSTFSICDAQGRVVEERSSRLVRDREAEWAQQSKKKKSGTAQEVLMQVHRQTRIEYDAHCIRTVRHTPNLSPFHPRAEFSITELLFDENGLARLWRVKHKDNPARLHSISYEFYS